METGINKKTIHMLKVGPRGSKRVTNCIEIDPKSLLEGSGGHLGPKSQQDTQKLARPPSVPPRNIKNHSVM
eukprot:9740049-Karenia_brevis.AAC.1